MGASAHVSSIEEQATAEPEQHRHQQQNQPDELQSGESSARLLYGGDNQIRIAPEFPEAIQGVFRLVGYLHEIVGMPA